MVELKDVSLNALSFHINDINLEVKEQVYFVLMGATGSGKSLLMKAICGLRPISKGRILIDKTDEQIFSRGHAG